MNREWSLDELYRGFDDPAFAEDEAKLESYISEYAAFAAALQGDAAALLEREITLSQALQSRACRLFSYAQLRQSVNTSDAEASAAAGRLSQKLSALAAPAAAFTQYVASLEDLDGIIAGSELLREHEFYLHCLRQRARYTLSPEIEQAISLYELSGSRAWGELQGFLTSTVPVEYEGGTVNLPAIRNKAYSADAAVRRSAYEAELRAYERIKDGIAFSLNSIKLEVISRCRLRGYDSPLDEALKNAHMRSETLHALLTAIEEALPRFWEYLRAKAALLGHQGALPWYDIFAPLQGSERQFTTEECRDYLVDLFSTFDQEESELIARAFEQSWIDFYPHEGKVGGAFCQSIHPIGESRVLTNYGGTLGDVVTLAHELGHAFHDYCLRDNSILNLDVSMPVAETASTFNEVVAMNAAIAAESDPITRRALIESQLRDATQIICDIYSRYLFESAVFQRRSDEFLFADELCRMMTDAQRRAYGSGLAEDTLHPYMWACKSHYYSGELSFYNFPYAFGGLFARGLYAKYLAEGESFVPLYKSLLRSTGTTTVEGAAQVAGIDLTDVDFWRSALRVLTDEIDEFLELCRL